jgi:hypothetical protein
MKKYYVLILLAIVFHSYSQTNTNETDIPLGNLPDPNIPARTLQDVRNEELNFNQSRDENLENALEVVAPIEGEMSEQKSPMDFVIEDANKVKMEGFSDIEHEELSNQSNLSKNEEIIDDTSNYKHSSFGGKILKIIGLIIFWFVAGFIINFFFYSGKPDHLVGKSQTAKTLHIALNIFTGIALLLNIIS